MGHNDTEINSALEFRLATPDVRGFNEHCQRLGLESAERCVQLAMSDVILLFQRREQSYYERKMIELRDKVEATAIGFADFIKDNHYTKDRDGGKGWYKYYENRTDFPAGYSMSLPVYEYFTTEELYNLYLKSIQ